jgi:hypothetical protein
MRITKSPAGRASAAPAHTQLQPRAPAAASSISRMGSHSRNGVSSTSLGQRSLQPLQHLAQAKGHRRRKQQGHRPQGQQHQRAAGVGREPALTHSAPAVHGTHALQQQGATAPSQPPARLSAKSTLDGTRGPAGSFAALHDQRQQRRRPVWPAARRRARRPGAAAPSASKNPSGPYPTTLAATSKPVQYLGSGAPEKPRAQCPGRASRSNGYRLA